MLGMDAQMGGARGREKGNFFPVLVPWVGQPQRQKLMTIPRTTQRGQIERRLFVCFFVEPEILPFPQRMFWNVWRTTPSLSLLSNVQLAAEDGIRIPKTGITIGAKSEKVAGTASYFPSCARIGRSDLHSPHSIHRHLGIWHQRLPGR